MEPYAGNLLNYPYTIRVQRSHKKGAADQKRILCEDIFTFDIETTSFFYESDRKPFLYEPGHDPDYWTGVYAGSLPYIWQFGINDTYYYGRDINDFYKLLEDFPEDMHVRIAVHNLPFEWHHLDKLTWSSLFAKSTHKPIKCSCAEFPNIEFFCTYSLTNRSLESWGDFLGVPKLTGYLDYNQMRTPLTPLDPKAMQYAERDLKVMYEGLKDELKVYQSVWKLPLTSTGKIRRICKDLLMSSEDYRKYIKRLIPENPYQYDTSLKVFSGGYTHCNRTYFNYTIYNDDGEHGMHVDYTSDYPFQMVANKFPCTRWAACPKELPDPDTFEDIAYKMHLVFHNIKCQTQNTYIPTAQTKSALINPEVDNGRLISADMCDIWITEQDFLIIQRMYTWDKVDVLECWRAGKDYLPRPFVEYILDLFHDKTALKGVDDAECALAKMRLNSLFGMCCTALLQGEVVWDPELESWDVKRITNDMKLEHLAKLMKKGNKQYFLNFDWGVWVCAYARRMLLDFVIDHDKNVLYCDTDSAFLNIKLDLTEYNENQKRRLEKVCMERGLDVEKTRPRNKKGKQSFLGVFTVEESFTQFRTLGAKRYVERWKSDGKLHLTVAGINKEAVSCLNDDIENFKDGLVFDKDEKDVTKLLHTYIDSMPEIVFPDGYVSTQKRGVNLRPNGYKLKVDASYDDLLGKVSSGSMNESYEKHLRSVWYDDIDELIEYAMGGLV